ncbi:MAG: LamG domain-containing protein [Acidobacteriota bacterium]
MKPNLLATLTVVAPIILWSCDESASTEQLLGVDPELIHNGKNHPGKGPGGPDGDSFALQFNGSTQSTQNDDLDLGSTFTIELWIKPDDVERIDPRQDFVSKWGTGAEASYAFWLRGSTIRLSTRVEPTNTVTFGQTLLQNGVWQHIAAVFNNGTVRLYVNGVLDVETMGNFTPQNTPTPLSLGRQDAPSFTCCYYDGIMDEVRIWSVARSQKEIQKKMNKQLNTNRLPAGLIAYWRMDEGSGDTAFDLTGNGHDMRLGNASGADAGDPVWVSPGKP